MSRLAFADMLLRDAAALLIIKATVVLALAGGAAAVAKGFSAAQRHMLWLVALTSCVWLMLSSRVVPAITIHTPALAETGVTTTPRPAAVALPSTGEAATANASRSQERLAGTQERLAHTEEVRRALLPSIPLPRRPLVALWIIGCVVLVVRHAVGVVGATRLARRASVASDDETMRELAGAAASVGVRRRIRLGYSTDIDTPITFGVATPVVLLPRQARSWSSERRRAVLIHEAAHIAHGDWLSQTIGRLACELFWFHPLAWRAFSRLRDEAERAADDCVLGSGMPVVEYATHLLELARLARNARPNLVTVGIVSTNHLERRFVAMFDAERSRAAVARRWRAITTTVALAIVCPLASLHVVGPVRRAAQVARTANTRSFAALRTTPDTTKSRSFAALRMTTPAVRTTAAARRTTTVALGMTTADSAPNAIAGAHPDFSGKWTQDTVAGPMVDSFVTDSLFIRQSANAFSLDGLGHVRDAGTQSHLHQVRFDGAESLGFTRTGNAAINVVYFAVWTGDTLVLTSHAQQGGHVLFTTERMTLSPDERTLFVANLSFLDGEYRWGGAHTFVFRRLTPQASARD